MKQTSNKILPKSCSTTNTINPKQARFQLACDIHTPSKKEKKKQSKKLCPPLPTYRFVAIMAPENRIILSALLRRLNWQHVSKVKPNHIIKTKLDTAYCKTVETSNQKSKRR